MSDRVNTTSALTDASRTGSQAADVSWTLTSTSPRAVRPIRYGVDRCNCHQSPAVHCCGSHQSGWVGSASGVRDTASLVTETSSDGRRPQPKALLVFLTR